jgi:hypothetical protein
MSAQQEEEEEEEEESVVYRVMNQSFGFMLKGAG